MGFLINFIETIYYISIYRNILVIITLTFLCFVYICTHMHTIFIEMWERYASFTSRIKYT